MKQSPFGNRPNGPVRSPTMADASTVLQLARWSTELGCRSYETVGTLWRHDLISERLLFDWLAIALVWDRLREVATGHRLERGNESVWETSRRWPPPKRRPRRRGRLRS